MERTSKICSSSVQEFWNGPWTDGGKGSVWFLIGDNTSALKASQFIFSVRISFVNQRYIFIHRSADRTSGQSVIEKFH